MSISRWKSLVETAKYQIYTSHKHDPFLNLSIEHYLLQKTPPDSTVLFLYVNKPCIVIGRNQNPWLEVNLGLLKQPPESVGRCDEGGQSRDVCLVRRRSGGGAVFHDDGNVNYSVICPSASFTRDKHAEMVTRAIRQFNKRARVNERHDIVLDQGYPIEGNGVADPFDLHKTAFQSDRSLKVSGSAYKITRQRSLHHGTCLLSSHSLASIPHFLRSPACPFLKARGVESVRTPVGNVFPNNQDNFGNIKDAFERSVIEAFRSLYGLDHESIQLFNDLSARQLASVGSVLRSGETWATGRFGKDLESMAKIREGIEELKSPRWMYGQTPQFILSSHAHEEDERERPPLPDSFPPFARVYLKARGGAFTETRISISRDEGVSHLEIDKFDTLLKDRNVHEIDDFEGLFATTGWKSSLEVSRIGQWLNTMFGKRT
ncbi:MAG: hypothetical protein Q9217_006691 [Psora testacea]